MDHLLRNILILKLLFSPELIIFMQKFSLFGDLLKKFLSFKLLGIFCFCFYLNLESFYHFFQCNLHLEGSFIFLLLPKCNLCHCAIFNILLFLGLW